jgi:O-antigen ligase
MQRSLTFVPGNWDNDMARDAAASNDFRQLIWRLWWHEYFPQHRLVGRGFGFKSEWTKPSAYNPRATDYKQMVEVGNIHNGLFASLDAVGIIGTLFFIAWNVQLLFRTFRVSFDKTNPAGFALRFLALQLAVSILCYWFGAVTLGTFLPQQFALAGVFLKLHRSVQHKPVAATLPQPVRQETPEVARV